MSSPSREQASDGEPPAATTDPQIVMAEQITHNVVNEAQQSAGDGSADCDTVSTTNTSAGNGETPSGTDTRDSKLSDNSAPQIVKTSDVASDAAPPSLSDTAGGDIGNVSVDSYTMGACAF